MSVLKRAFGDVLRIGLFGTDLYLLLQFSLQLSVGPLQKIIFKLQVLNGFLAFLDFFAQTLELLDEFLELVIVEVVELVHFELYDFLAQLTVLLQDLLQL